MKNTICKKAHEVCNKFKDKLEEDIEVADVYVAINAQYHDYCKLFEKWFGKGNFDDMIFESAIDFWFDDVDFGEDKLWKYFNELKQYKFCYIPKERLLNNSSLSFLFKIKFYICCVI